jgi:predicted kinase
VPDLIIISGRPCTGKTTLSRRLAADLELPLFNRDGLKELLFDVLGWSDREWSRRLGGASHALLLHAAERVLSANLSCMIESNFYPQIHSLPIQQLAQRTGVRTLEVYCHTDPDVLVERFRARAHSQERHPGHVDHLLLEEFEEQFRRPGYDLLDLDGSSYVIDTTDLANLDYEEVLTAVRATLNKIESPHPRSTGR